MLSELLKPLSDLPDVSFIDNDTAAAMMERMVANYEIKYKKITGEEISLGAADPMRILIYTCVLELYQVEQYVDRAGKQDLLKYSYGEYLDNLAPMRSVSRNGATAASATVRFTVSANKDYALPIPQGIRVTNGAGLFFVTQEYAEVAPGESYVDVETVCTVTGEQGNDFLPGQINVLVDPLPYVQSVANTTTSAGGASVESDESLAERTYLAPSGYSTAGPADAYTFWAKTYNAGIGSVVPYSDEPLAGQVHLYVLMADGSMPSEEIISGLTEFLQNRQVRPLTDLVTVMKPEAANFDVDLTYYINRSDSARAVQIQEAVQAAVSDYVTWQTAQIGRDINPDELTRRIKAAGAKRVVITSPTFTVVQPTHVAQCQNKTVNNGGLEDE